MDMHDALSGLNPAQTAAVTAAAPVVQILAPPGSGKTKTLTARVAHLLSHHGYLPANTLCLTFTVKSAREMKERIARLVGDGMESRLVLGTFHSVCRRYLVSYGHLIGIKRGFGIADSTDTLNIIKRIVKRMHTGLDAGTIRGRISRSKAKRVGYEDLRREESQANKRVDQQEFLQAFAEYESHLAVSNLLDYDDLLVRCAELLQQFPKVVSNVEAVLIDEFQDTNTVQFELMQLFASAKRRITTVGDPDQSIYGWRSAEIKNLKKMQALYPETLVLNLESNYRSSGAILAAAREVIEQDTARPPKPLLPTHSHGTLPVLRKLRSSHDEALWIVSEIRRTMTLSGGQLLNYSDYAILLRSAALSRQIEAALGNAGMPYRMVGGARFFDRVEIKILLNYMRAIATPSNGEAFSAIINVPPRRIGESTVKGLVEEARQKGTALFDLAHDIAHGNKTATTKIAKPAQNGLRTVVDIVLTARKKMAEEASCYPAEVLEYILGRLDYKEYLTRTYPEDEDSRWANVEELQAQASDAAYRPGAATDEDQLPTLDAVAQQEAVHPTEEALTKFLANVALSTEIQTDDDPDNPQHRIVISTIHAAKGLEWPIVFVPAVYQGSIPHSRAEDSDEERRLLYVAMTRAQALLYLSRPLRSSTSSEETNESDFLAGKRIKRKFAAKAPLLTPAAVRDIAQILRRPPPSEEQLHAALTKVDNVADDLYLEDGVERSRVWEPDGPASKRRCLAGDNVPIAATLPATGSGFVSASSHWTTMASMTTPATTSAAASSRTMSLQRKPHTLSSIRRPNGPAAPSAPTLPLAPLQPASDNARLPPPRLEPHLALHAVCRAGSNRPKVAEANAPTYVFLSSSPPPPDADAASGPATSSMPHAVPPTAPSWPNAADAPGSPAMSSVPYAVPPIAPSRSNAPYYPPASAAAAAPLCSSAVPAQQPPASSVRSAATLHTTSMDHLQRPKSLGMRRSVAGWAPRAATKATAPASGLPRFTAPRFVMPPVVAPRPVDTAALPPPRPGGTVGGHVYN